VAHCSTSFGATLNPDAPSLRASLLLARSSLPLHTLGAATGGGVAPAGATAGECAGAGSAPRPAVVPPTPES